jgi:hypothetical protein
MPVANLKPKTLDLNGVAIGPATTWHEVAELLSKSLGRSFSPSAAKNKGSEGPAGFYIELKH